jgi:hypothetical protein
MFGFQLSIIMEDWAPKVTPACQESLLVISHLAPLQRFTNVANHM